MAAIKFPRALDGEWLERRRGYAAGANLTFDLSAWNDTRLLGEARLLRWLAAARSEGTRIEVWLGREVVPNDFEGAPEAADLLRDRLAMYLLTAFADSVLSARGKELKLELEEAHSRELVRTEPSGAIGFGREQALLAIDRIGAPVPFAAFGRWQLDYMSLDGRVRDMVRSLGLGRGDAQRIDEVISFAAEALENTANHAQFTTTRPPDRVQGLRFLQIRRIQVSSDTPQQSSPSRRGPVYEYLTRHAERVGAHEASRVRIVEVSVADCGDGIAAQMFGGREIFDAPLGAEIEVTLGAMRRGSSSKPSTEHGRGQGLPNALRAAEASGGLVSLHTGRLRLTLDTTNPAPAGQDGWHIEEASYAPGTAFSLLVPWDQDER
jgi:hypothetical protein